MYTNNGEKRREILPFAATWVHLEDLISSERGQTEKDRSCLHEIPHIVRPVGAESRMVGPGAEEGGFCSASERGPEVCGTAQPEASHKGHILIHLGKDGQFNKH